MPFVVALLGILSQSPNAHAQARPYIGFVYPAGGQQGTTFRVRVGGQNLDQVSEAIVSGDGVSAKIVEFRRKLGPQEIQLLREQVNELKGVPPPKKKGDGKKDKKPADKPATAKTKEPPTPAKDAPPLDPAARKLVEKIETRIAEYAQRPACNSIATIVIVDVTIAPEAEPGRRQLVLGTPHGASNPLVFDVGQLPEVSRQPMITAEFQVLGKEELALRKRPVEQEETRITLPCTMNGQIASGEVNRYRFTARKGQRLVIAARARQLTPYIADAVPGWFQPVLTLRNARGTEVAYNDDYRFQPDPVILFQVPESGEYVLHIADALYRGREDFVYRISIGQLPFVTSVFPLGCQAGTDAAVRMSGWNLASAQLVLPGQEAAPGTYSVAAWRNGFASNRVPFAIGTLPECFEAEPNDDRAHAQKIKLPMVINGRIGARGDCDVFEVSGRAGDTVVAEVSARRLDSPLDSLLRITDATGALLALNDDHETPEFAVRTHPADSYLMFKLPADGAYYVHLSDLARAGGDDYAYRLRLSASQPDFALYAVPSTVTMRGKGGTAVSVYVVRKDGFAGPVKVQLKKDAPSGFTASPATLAPNQTTVKLGLKTTRTGTDHPVDLVIEGSAKIAGREVVHAAVPAEDRMEAFLWRHLTPADDLKATVVDPSYQQRARRFAKATPPPPPATPPAEAAKPSSNQSANPAAPKPKFTKQQVAGRLRQLKMLFDDELLTEPFYARKVAECEASMIEAK